MRTFPTGEAPHSFAEMQRLLAEPDVTVTYNEGQRQVVVLALARLAAERPGFMSMLQEIALKMDNQSDGLPEMFMKLHGFAIQEKQP